jgi:hypothetical protein
MLGVKDQRNIQGLNFFRSRLSTAKHIQEISGLTQVLSGGYREQSLGKPIVIHDCHWYLSQESFGFPYVGIMGIIRSILVKMTQSRDSSPKGIQRWRPLGQRGEKVSQGWRQPTGRSDTRLKGMKFTGSRQLPVEQ